jgi:hypothetical protein
MKSLDFFFNLPNPLSGTVAQGSIQPLKEMAIRIIPGGGGVYIGRRVKPDNRTAICEPNV